MERASWVHQQVMTGQSSFQVACAEAEASLWWACETQAKRRAYAPSG
jgi:hypothetical protein